MENTPEESDDGEEEDWMAIDWNGCLPSEIKRGHSNNGEGVIKQSSLGTERQQNDDSEEITSEDKVHREPLMSRMLLNDNKAGMSGLDKDRINQIILEASKGSKYFENERKKEEQVTKRIEEQRQKMKIITPEQLEIAEKEADLLLEDFDRLRDLSKTIVHVDMDAFYAAVEMRDNPSLRDKPMAVGGNSMLSTSNYHARKFGVRAAMPGFIGKKLCPELVIVPLHFDKYTAVSKQVKEILGTFDPNFCSVSLDEAYLDLTEHVTKRQGLSAKERSIICRLCDSFDKNCCLCDLNETVGMTCCEDGSVKVKNTSTNICDTCRKPIPEFELVTFGTTVEEAVKEMRCRIQQKTCLTASAGIAPNMMLAKVCSDMNKPNGQYLIPSTVEDVMSFIRNLPIRKISGIGKVSERMLNAVGVKTCQELYDKRGLLYHLYSQISFNYFMRICLGIGSTTVERDGERKSMSTERTFSEISAPTELYSKCLELCHSLAEDLQEEELKGKTVTIKIKTVKFDVKTRACSIPDYTNDAEVIFIAAKDLLCKEIKNVHPQPLQLRLMGVRMSSLVEQTLVSSKVQQNTLLQFVRKGEKVGKHEMQQNKEKCFQKESGVDAQILCSEKTDQSTDEQNPHVNASDTHINHCDNYKKKSSEQDGKQEIESKNLETKAEISEIEGASNTDLPGYESERRPVSDKGNSQEMEDKPDSVWYTCPVCRDEVGCTDLHAFNHHIDSCLSRSVVKECSRYQQEPGNSKNKGTSSRKTVTPKRKAASSKQVKTSVKTPHKSSGAVKTQDLNCSVKQKTSLNPTASKSIEIPSESSSNGLKMNTSSNSSNEPSGDAIKELPSCANRETLVCPVCFMEQTGVDLDAFNRHVDSCLCKGTITEILKEQRHSYKRPLEKQGTPGQGGKRKRQESGPKSSTSIASFFQMNS